MTIGLLSTGFLAGIIIANFYWMPRLWREREKRLQLASEHRKEWKGVVERYGDLIHIQDSERSDAETMRQACVDVVQLFMPPITAEYSDDDRSLTRTLNALIAEINRLPIPKPRKSND